MTRLTWLGSEDYREGESPLESCVWNGVLFTAGDKVEVTDEWMINKARGNRFFRVEENGKGEEPVPGPFGPMPETWTNDEPRYPDNPPDYPPEDDPDRRGHDYPPEEREPNKKRRGRPPRIRENSDGDQ